MQSPATEPRTSLAAALGWGFYLASSWTWVIGMYLPVLLVRDYGLGGWIAFAVPNVIGAAAMGWALRSQQQAHRLAAEHATAVSLFTVVTISFQVFALMWLLPRLVDWPGIGLVLLALLCALVMPLSSGLGRPLNAIAVWAISAAVFAMLAAGNVLEFPPATGRDSSWDLLGLAPACALGFALCPYLDATFLRARQQTDARGAKIAFGVGFGVLFLTMIVFTLFYAVPLDTGVFTAGAAWLLASHLTLQVCFTVAAHTAALGRIMPASVWGIVIAAGLGLAALGAELGEARLFNLSAGELIYRGYMGFYGLLFPAYVLLVIVARASMRLYAVACLVALPFFVVGFAMGQMRWSVVGVLVVLVAALPTMHRRRAARAAGGYAE